MSDPDDKQFWRQIGSCDEAIGSDLALNSPNLSQPERASTSRRVLLALLGLTLCQTHQILPDDAIATLQKSGQSHLWQLWQTLAPQLQALLPLPQPLNLSDRTWNAVLRCLQEFCSSLTLNTLGSLYEFLLKRSAVLRKSGGIYYTPNAIVDFVIGQAANPEQTATPTLLDPACGAGAFLLAAYQKLLDQRLTCCMATAATSSLIWHGDRWHLAWAERLSILQNCIYGVDLDPQAVALTRFSLLLKLLETPDRPIALTAALPDLSQTIRCGNAVIGAARDAIDWQQAFPQIFAAGGFDAVVGNPPYLDSEQMKARFPDWRHYCVQHYRTAAGNWDLFCVFIEQALQLCKPGGTTSLVVPNKLLSASYAANARSLLTQEAQLMTIRDYTQAAAFRASVYPIVYVARRAPPQAAHPTCYEQMQSLDRVKVAYSLQLSSLAHSSINPSAHSSAGSSHDSSDHSLQSSPSIAASFPWQLSSTPILSQLMQRLRQQLPMLKNLVQVSGAATVSEAYGLQALILDSERSALDHVRLVNSGTIDRYCLLWGKKRLRYLGCSYLHPIVLLSSLEQLTHRRQQQAQQPKIIVAGMTQRLECALDATGGILAGKSTAVIQPHPAALMSIDLRYLLGVLNSQLIHAYVLSHFSGNCLQGQYLRIGAPQLRQLPICLPTRTQQEQMIELVEQIQQAATHAAEQAIDQLVYRLYQLSDREIEQVEQMIDRRDRL